MSASSFPYLRLSRMIGCKYGRVLGIADKLDAGSSADDIDDPMAWNVHYVWSKEQDRRRDASAQ